MIAYDLNNLDKVNHLVNTCQKYKDEYNIDFDICFRRYVADGTSVLGCAAMLGNIISVQPVGDVNNKIINDFTCDLRGIK